MTESVNGKIGTHWSEAQIQDKHRQNRFCRTGQNQGSQTQNSTSSSGMSASRISNKVLQRLLYSDDLASYPNSSLIRKFSKTFSKY